MEADGEGSRAPPTTPLSRPTACLVVGMAGSGKTTLMQRINHYCVEQETTNAAAGTSGGGGGASGGGDSLVADGSSGAAPSPSRKPQPTYYVNMDPAVRTVPFAAGIDIRDTVDYKEVMKQYNLGPNGGIMTALNLFATRFDQVHHAHAHHTAK